MSGFIQAQWILSTRFLYIIYVKKKSQILLLLYCNKWQMETTKKSTIFIFLIEPHCSRKYALQFCTFRTFTFHFTMTVFLCNMINSFTAKWVHPMPWNFRFFCTKIIEFFKFPTAIPTLLKVTYALVLTTKSTVVNYLQYTKLVKSHDIPHFFRYSDRPTHFHKTFSNFQINH